MDLKATYHLTAQPYFHFQTEDTQLLLKQVTLLLNSQCLDPITIKVVAVAVIRRSITKVGTAAVVEIPDQCFSITTQNASILIVNTSDASLVLSIYITTRNRRKNSCTSLLPISFEPADV